MEKKRNFANMGRKKNLKGIDPSDLEIINNKMMREPQQSFMDNSIIKLDYKVNIKCKNKKQKDFLSLLKDPNKKICFGMGSAGSGKSYISLAYGLQSLKNCEFDKIIIFVPTVQAGSSAIHLGFLKGTLEEKTDVYKSVDQYTIEKILSDSGNINPKGMAQALFTSDKIRYELIQFVRGKSFDHSLILLNESENISKEEMILLLTRLGEGSKIIITGDELQKDRKDIKGKSGMVIAYEKLNAMEEVGETTFTDEDIVRNPLITKILEIWKE